MAGYTRQSIADIINGSEVTAPPINAEFNQIAAAFAASTGHTHDGTTGNAPKIDVTTSLSGYIPAAHGGVGGKNKLDATVNPTTTDDAGDGYSPGSLWENTTTGRIFICVGNTANAAVWRELVQVETGNVIKPITHDQIDLGTPSIRFQDLWLSGGVGAAGNVAVGGTLNISGASTLASLGVTGNATVGGTTTLTGALTANGGLTVNGATSLVGNVTLGDSFSQTDTVAFAAGISSHLVPFTDDLLDLGSPDNEWRNLHVDGTANIDDLVADQVDINSGAIDNTTIGAGTAVSAAFDGLTVTGAVNMSGATISNLGTVTTVDMNGGTIDGASFGASTPITEATIDNIKIDGSSIVSTNSNNNITIAPHGTGSVVITKIDANSGTIDNTAIGGNVASTGAFTTLSTTGQATLNSAVITGGSINSTPIGGTTPQTGAFTTLSASGGITGDLAGNVTGNTNGTHTGPVSGTVTGSLTGNVTATTGTSTFNNVTVNGTLNMDAATSATIVNLTDPVNPQDAATRNYVDTRITNLIDGAPSALDTLNELAAALADDANAYGTLDTKINTKVSKAGDTMTGNLDMGANKVTSTGTPSANADLTNKSYVDTQRDTRLATAGGTMSGNIDLGGNLVSNAGAPVAGGDLTNKTYVDGILGSATAAATSATNAATSETNAANSATAAASSATSAAADLVSVQNIYDQFDDRYLGAYGTAPTVDNDGDALVVGALFFDTSTSSMKVYSASGWVPAGSSVNGTSARFKYTCTANQNTFSGADDASNSLEYDAGYLDVYVNGVKLVNGSDFTATTGTSIQLLFNTSAGDILEVVAYGTFTLADHEMDDLNDVTTVGITNGQVLKYDTANSRFVAGDADVVADAVNTAAVQDAAITTAKIADDAVTQAKIAAGAIGDTELGTVNATAIDYSNTVSGISANTVQEAIDYLNTLSGSSSGSVASYTRDKFVATAGQTTFTPSNGYTLGYLQVFLNGILLDITDYTATNGTTVVLTDAADANDEVVIIALDSFAIAEILRVTDISASAGNNSITIGANGGLGVGGTPATSIHGSFSGPNAYSSTLTKGNNHAGLTLTQQYNTDDMVGVMFATGNDSGGSHWSGITGSRTNSAVHWGTQLNFYTHDHDTSNIDDATQKMVLTGQGRLGLGNNNPTESLAVRTWGNSEISTQYGTGTKAKLAAYSNAAAVHLPSASVAFSVESETGAMDTLNMRSDFGGNTYKGLRMDTYGRVTTPYQPAFSARLSSTYTNTGGYNKISTLQATYYNRGNHYNTSLSRFVAPVSGVYSFGFQFLLANVNNGDDSIHIAFMKNGSIELYSNVRAPGSSANNVVGYGGYLPVIGSLEVYLNASDYIELAMSNINTVDVYYSSGGDWGRFFGHLIG